MEFHNHPLISSLVEKQACRKQFMEDSIVYEARAITDSHLGKLPPLAPAYVGIFVLILLVICTLLSAVG